jgi:hypothetical protein
MPKIMVGGTLWYLIELLDVLGYMNGGLRVPPQTKFNS